MLIDRLKIENFRNVISADISFSPDVNLFCGDNGAGKTNLLEAIFVLLLARSPRGVSDTVMCRESAEYYRLEGFVVHDDIKKSVALAYQRGGRKKITIENVAVKASELFESFTAVSSSPHDIEIVAGGPSLRRDFVDIYLSQASVKYLADLVDYRKALAQKNAFLKQENNGAETPYDELLIRYGTRIMHARRKFIELIGQRAQIHYAHVAAGGQFNMKYQPSVKMDDDLDEIPPIEEAFKEKLNQYRERERIMQTAMVGPHRDDVVFTVRDLPARTHGSQGELRTIAVSLKMAVFEYLKEIKKTTPVLLLDEIFAELDPGRKTMLVELFGEFGQIFLTTASDIPESLSGQAKRFKIVDGVISPE